MRITDHPLYDTWIGIKRRCLSPKSAAYASYGGRGITICDKWKESFEAFAADVGKRPPGLSLDRIDNNGNYEPSNVRWATQKQQTRNGRHNVWMTHGGRKMLMTDWADELGITRQALSARIRRGLTGDELFAPRPERQHARKRRLLLEHNGKRMSVTEWSRELGIKRTCILYRLHIGLPIADVLDPAPRRRAV